MCAVLCSDKVSRSQLMMGGALQFVYLYFLVSELDPWGARQPSVYAMVTKHSTRD